MVGFVAAMQREQVTLLPGDRSRQALVLLAERYAGLYSLTDAGGQGARPRTAERMVVDARGESGTPPRAIESIPADRIVAIAFTSGTTGTPVPHPKRWRTLRANARICARYAGIGVRPATAPAAIVATVPVQHMYGLEFSILVPLLEGASVHTGQPLLPADIAAALSSLPVPRILVTTPYHLRALGRARPALPPLEAVVSATAPLTAGLAARIEEAYSTRVLEIYGCTEAGTVASRRTVTGEPWHCAPDFRLESDGNRCILHADHLDGPVPLQDIIRLTSPQSFALCGRGGDLIDVAGKRASLSGLNTILTDIDGVIDGAFFQPRTREVESVSRLVAIVVAPGTSAEAILKALRARVDPAFLPRRVYHVDALPRSGASKLTRAALAEVARRLGVDDPC